HQYDDAGNVLSTTSPLLHSTTFSYDDSWGDAHCGPAGRAGAYLTRVTNAVSHSTQHTYNSCTGTPASTTDPNNQVTTFGPYDRLARLTQTTYPDGGQSSACFSDDPGTSCYSASLPLTQTQTQLITQSVGMTRKSVLDGVGNVIQTQLASDPEGTDYVDIGYDGLGQKISQSNPYRSTPSATDGSTHYQYDGLGRITDVTQPDNNVIHTDYVGSLTYGSNQLAAATTVTDETGRQ